MPALTHSRANDRPTRTIEMGDAAKSRQSLETKENLMPNNDREGKLGAGTLVAIVAVFILAFAFFVWGSGTGSHVASNPGPRGMPESNIVNQAPPPASSPSETTTGTAR
jgi:hypothetical protein